MNSANVVQALVREEASSEQIARNSPLSENFVALVARGLHDPNLVRSREMREDGPAIFPFWQKWTNRPWLFVFSSTLIALLLFLLVSFTIGKTIGNSKTVWQVLAGLIIFGTTAILHTVCYLRHCMVRHVFFGAAGILGASLVYTLIMFVLRQASIAAALGYLFSGIFFTFLYGLFQVPIAVFGGYLRVRKQMQTRTNLTRQQLIEKLFDVRERLARVTVGMAPESSWADRRWVVWLRDNIFSLAGISGVATSLIYVLIACIFDPDGKVYGRDDASTIALVSHNLNGITTLLLSFVIGLGAQRPARAVTAFLLFFLIRIPFFLIPIRPFGPGFFKAEFLYGSIGALVVSMLIVFACSVAVTIEQSARRDRMLDANNREILESEVADLERRLRPETRRICVMDVDAYRSARMKADADAFEAEWSFREYQIWIARVCNRYLGVVHATAGDGAVVGFPSSAQALEAAIALQAEMAVFNLRVNRLPTPFMIRIGLHTGEVQGALDQVQFTEVIDVAAHVQKAVPVGTIGLTERTVENLDHSQFQAMPQKVDGYSVYVLNGVCGPAETS